MRDASPARLGDYELHERLGAGGMGEVWAATRRMAGGVSQDVVIKRVRGERADDSGFAERFLDEARIAARLDHPNLVRVVDFGRADGAWYLALERVHGADLSRVLRGAGGKLPTGIALTIAHDVAAGLHAAHTATDAQGRPLRLVHRDVCAANVLIGHDGRVRLTDFGVAALAGDQDAEVVGHLSTMSPEQLAGRPVDARSDVYSLGVVLFELLTGGLPGGAAGRTGGGRAVEVPAGLQPLLNCALALDPDDRYPSAEAFRAALREALSPSAPDLQATALRGLLPAWLTAPVTTEDAATVVDPVSAPTVLLGGALDESVPPALAEATQVSVPGEQAPTVPDPLRGAGEGAEGVHRTRGDAETVVVGTSAGAVTATGGVDGGTLGEGDRSAVFVGAPRAAEGVDGAAATGEGAAGGSSAGLLAAASGGPPASGTPRLFPAVAPGERRPSDAEDVDGAPAPGAPTASVGALSASRSAPAPDRAGIWLAGLLAAAVALLAVSWPTGPAPSDATTNRGAPAAAAPARAAAVGAPREAAGASRSRGAPLGADAVADGPAGLGSSSSASTDLQNPSAASPAAAASSTSSASTDLQNPSAASPAAAASSPSSASTDPQNAAAAASSAAASSPSSASTDLQNPSAASPAAAASSPSSASTDPQNAAAAASSAPASRSPSSASTDPQNASTTTSANPPARRVESAPSPSPRPSAAPARGASARSATRPSAAPLDEAAFDADLLGDPGSDASPAAAPTATNASPDLPEDPPDELLDADPEAVAEADLSADTPGTLTLRLSNNWGWVRIDGKKIKGTTPIDGLALLPGAHTIRVETPSTGRVYHRDVTIRPGKTAVVVIEVD